MKPFLHAHATHPDAHLALALAAAQIEAQRKKAPQQPTLGWLYLTEAFVPKAEALLAELRLRWPGVAWVGASGVGICAGGVEYFDEPALALMLAELPTGQFRVFNGARPLGRWDAELTQVHADGSSIELQELLTELADETRSGYLFGGLASGRRDSVHLADGVWRGGLSGVAFAAPADSGLRVLSRVGHLSNSAAAEFLLRDYDGGAHTIVLGHLSEQNNLPELARLAAEKAIGDRLTLLGNRILLAVQNAPLEPICL